MKITIAAVTALVVLATLGYVYRTPVSDKTVAIGGDVSDKLYSLSITEANLMSRLSDLQAIAEEYDYSRAVNYGYNASADYVVQTLQGNTDFSVSVQVFPVSQMVENSPPELEQISPESETYKSGVDFNIMSYSGAGDPQADIEFVNHGCEPDDFRGFKQGAIALMERGECGFNDKAALAYANGASGALIYNYGTPGNLGPVSGTLGEVIPIPVFGISYDLGLALMSTTPVPVMRMHADTEEVISYTRNVLADTQKGDPTQTIVVGSHLDSVPAGPGINDNGSGAMANLEMAVQFYRLQVENKNRVRFAWWGAEELGLLGSTYYVNSIVKSGEVKDVALNLNYDMLGSPNFFRGVYNGSQAAAEIREKSMAITTLYADYFNSNGLYYNLTDFTGRSDYGPFIENGVPAGGLFSGAEVKKTELQRTLYGGLANAAYDPCYHAHCDSVENIDTDGYLEMAQAAAFVLHNLSQRNLNELTTADEQVHLLDTGEPMPGPSCSRLSER